MENRLLGIRAAILGKVLHERDEFKKELVQSKTEIRGIRKNIKFIELEKTTSQTQRVKTEKCSKLIKNYLGNENQSNAWP